MTSHDRFKAWFLETMGEEFKPGAQSPFDAGLSVGWYAAEKATARRCAEIAVTPYSHAGSQISRGIRDEYTEAFTSDPPAAPPDTPPTA